MTEFDKHIDDYLNGRLSPSDLEAFEVKLNEDDQFRIEVETYRDIENVLGNAEYKLSEEAKGKEEAYLKLLLSNEGNKIQKSISKAESKYFKEIAPKRENGKLNYLFIAVLIALLLSLFYWLKPSDLSNDELFAQYKDYSRLPSFTIRSEQADLAIGENLFNKQKYAEALMIFEKYTLKNNANFNSQVLLYQACCLLELDKNAEAIELLNQLTNSSSLDSGIGKWYLAQAYLKIENENASLQLLKEIVSDAQNFKFQEAKDLLELLELK